MIYSAKKLPTAIAIENKTVSLERISWLYYFQLDRFIFERESGV
jgi:hypothetical protein